MGWTKKQLVEQAFDIIGLGTYSYDLQPEQLNTALVKLDMMMASWNGKGIRLGYNLPSTQSSGSLTDDSGVPDSAYEAIALNLAVRIAPSFGKVISPDTRLDAKGAYDVIANRATMPKPRQLTRLPKGAGHKSWRSNGDPFLSDAQDNIEAGADGDIDFN
jgi:hypothetical protein